MSGPTSILRSARSCGGAAGLLFYPQNFVVEATWWLTLGILSSVGLGTGLHSGIMFLWPFCMSVILPFVPFMVEGFLQGPDQDIGYYSGLLGAAYQLGQLCFPFWGAISDKIGWRLCGNQP